MEKLTARQVIDELFSECKIIGGTMYRNNSAYGCIESKGVETAMHEFAYQQTASIIEEVERVRDELVTTKATSYEIASISPELEREHFYGRYMAYSKAINALDELITKLKK